MPSIVLRRIDQSPGEDDTLFDAHYALEKKTNNNASGSGAFTSSDMSSDTSSVTQNSATPKQAPANSPTPGRRGLFRSASARSWRRLMPGGAAAAAAEEEKRRLKAKKKVRFDKQMQVHDTIHINDMEEEEIANSWYRNMEYQIYQSDGEDCFRGLEAMTDEGLERQKNNTIRSIYAVLDEQERQRYQGIADVSVLAAVYIQVTRHCRAEARQLGINDAKDAGIPEHSLSSKPRLVPLKENSNQKRRGSNGSSNSAPIPFLGIKRDSLMLRTGRQDSKRVLMAKKDPNSDAAREIAENRDNGDHGRSAKRSGSSRGRNLWRRMRRVILKKGTQSQTSSTGHMAMPDQ
mmetsp:Transcript_8587/g.19889  ORF Transcript_8587/g.19889 Transcript_8587/m.19889 type:complete len:347 (-) Transcript_8587:173-1213(-)|eukprot:CAMPEP_0116840966 /NCGR_PEP_ID=MMETSP0418-20121206/10658_1 /TAXON_ID=1158023 /ORGANISM="Astrosyne radiata, Strain 13vi08-1A" /LENGTH=346 /DNA_ID=CAMNT_0004471331 /DNA_START=202 /DNA_END=1242 /DNA_ORIENTATION=-